MIRFLLLFVFLWAVTPATVRADLSAKDARKAIQTMLGASLPSSAVHVDRVSAGAEGVAEASAEIEAVFRVKQVDGRWRLGEIRTGQDTWEQLELIAQAVGAQLPTGGCDAPAEFARSKSAKELNVKRARCLVAELLGVTLPSDRVRVRNISLFELPFGSESSALIETSVQVEFRFARDARGWQVSEFKSGNREWVRIDTLATALNNVKRAAAASDLNTMAGALNDFRRERGSFVISDKQSVLVDHLNPQYLKRVIRLDPWHRPYQYEGTQDHFSLRSIGADGKPQTGDDITVSGAR
ncbi:MAG TPA: type II secretion system protein GspG [Pyrinomonadaceae bacterium]|nr:type II secretion system protein GspG [Pyrinomonadaceae bacterium]